MERTKRLRLTPAALSSLYFVSHLWSCARVTASRRGMPGAGAARDREENSPPPLSQQPGKNDILGRYPHVLDARDNASSNPPCNTWQHTRSTHTYSRGDSSATDIFPSTERPAAS
ncbi:hypothetical protein K474DRAFT_1663205 [Panus rudis PR-1116 ss-1]|nr:hypothetical protein K474DRAFT_1663205 [Panus rudis PR-1116 ss-1]